MAKKIEVQEVLNGNEGRALIINAGGTHKRVAFNVFQVKKGREVKSSVETVGSTALREYFCGADEDSYLGWKASTAALDTLIQGEVEYLTFKTDGVLYHARLAKQSCQT